MTDDSTSDTIVSMIPEYFAPLAVALEHHASTIEANIQEMKGLRDVIEGFRIAYDHALWNAKRPRVLNAHASKSGIHAPVTCCHHNADSPALVTTTVQESRADLFRDASFTSNCLAACPTCHKQTTEYEKKVQVRLKAAERTARQKGTTSP